ncbi:type VI secretion system baseplate subunit TssG [Pseudomonas putida]|uniref:type VI secretion system baseplate subunit TssG n=1 Tax=Pseudomonas putida TaxID=303 RepID=UPI00081957C3|nr:type VI secretion system baseplate subunit TssG [Pseudomonas putida]OCT21276.1 type VI secretion protein [Pseudomonas putida]OCT22669.1 type VI secretion protein [Pseudomonas putida]OCT37383.1 type VI secretion protein [Pseudomonas putida]OCT40837.1 type VI secretion protein [Pseudomonas putida]
MANPDRQATADLADKLLADAHQYNFFQLLERLHGLHGDDLEPRWPAEATRLRVRLGCDPRLTFPVSDVYKADRIPGAADRYRVCATFMGLHGTDSPLPSYYLDQVAYEHAQGIGVRPEFFDFFNHYLLSLLHRIWRKYRYYIRFQPGASDGFSQYIFALLGLNDKQLRGDTPLPWSRLLSFAGVIASRSRAPGTVAGIIAHCFDLKQVKIREFETRLVPTATQQLVSLGRSNGELGSSFMVGSRTRTRSSKFTIVISELDQDQLRDLLPSGINFNRLRALIDFLLRDGLAYDLELRLKQNALSPFCLHASQGAYLGWTSFVDDRHGQITPVVRFRGRS